MARANTNVTARFDTLDEMEVECTHCGTRMSTHLGSGRVVRYFQCSSCSRWVSSMYREVINSSAKVRGFPRPDEAPEARRFEDVKDRLERWLAAIDDQDPYRILGASPLDSVEVIRAKYHALALERHPDRGGSSAQMTELNDAYERVLRHRERRKLESLPSGPAAAVGELPDLNR